MISAAGRAKRAEYQKQYRRAHPEKVRQWNENHWNRKAKEMEQQIILKGEETDGTISETIDN